MIYSLEAILKASQKVPHVCYPLLSKGGILVIGAPAKARKSYFAMHLSYCLASGTSFLGMSVEKAQRVLYIEKEIGIAGVRDRIEQIHRQYGDDFASENLMLLPKSKAARKISLSDPEGFKLLQSKVEEKNPDVIVLDPLRRFHRADEDKSGEMEKVFDAIEQLQDDGRRSVIVVHHCGKPSEHRKEDDPVALRGSSFIFDAGDSYVMLLKASRQSDKYKLHFTFRHTKDTEPMSARFEDGIFVKSGKADE